MLNNHNIITGYSNCHVYLWCHPRIWIQGPRSLNFAPLGNPFFCEMRLWWFVTKVKWRLLRDLESGYWSQGGGDLQDGVIRLCYSKSRSSGSRTLMMILSSLSSSGRNRKRVCYDLTSLYSKNYTNFDSQKHECSDLLKLNLSQNFFKRW